MPEKTRRPATELSHADYLGWIKNVRKWLDKRAGEPDYPSHLAAGFAALVDEYAIWVGKWASLRSSAKGKNTTLADAYKKLRDQIILIKKVLPTVAENPPVLGQFGISGRIPRDRDDIYIMARSCLNSWAELCDPVVPPEFMPMQPEFAALQTKFSDFVGARSDYNTTTLR